MNPELIHMWRGAKISFVRKGSIVAFRNLTSKGGNRTMHKIAAALSDLYGRAA